ncbi:MAG TPA: PrsW family intramembrane metalloprotease [Pyrinomonadaceae bacterium]|nr:PrsW family intramembrane metalloprotease [Pyrinomonadaceae bacterium]
MDAFNQPVTNYSPVPALAPRPRLSAIKILAVIIAILFAVLLGLIVLLFIGAETGLVELIIGMVCAILPVPIYVMLLLWIDRYESEPLWMLATTFFWGALIAVFIALLLNTSVEIITTIATRSDELAANVGAVISAPIVEESAKASILFIFFFWKKDEFDGIVDGIVYAGMVGLGFAMTENILYYGRAMQKGPDALTVVFILRGMAAPFSHPLFTSMTGIGLGWSRQTRNSFIKFAMPIFGFGLAILMHATWNGSAAFGQGLGFFVAYFMIMGPAFIIILMVIHFSLRREGRIVQEFLYPDYQTGFFDRHEYEKLCTIRGRMGLSWDALWSQGFGGWRLRMRCNQMASELAFHRSRVARGIGRDPKAAQEREVDYRATLQQLRQQIAQRQRGFR